MKELIDQSISDVQLLLNFMVCEDQTDQVICEEILNNIADRLGKALDKISESERRKPMNESYVRKQIARYERESGYGMDDALYLIANHCNITRAVNFDEMTEAERAGQGLLSGILKGDNP